jgi:hypothetical protein
MDKVEITNFIKKHEPLPWKASTIRGENQLVCWLPIIDLSGNDHYFGLIKEGFWVADTCDQLVKLDKNSSFVPLLPMLEFQCEDFLTELKNSFKSWGLPITMVSYFPLLEGIICGLETMSNYWAKLALKWLESCEELQMLPLIPFLEKLYLANNKQVSQQVRHKSQRILKKIQSATVAR